MTNKPKAYKPRRSYFGHIGRPKKKTSTKKETCEYSKR